MSSESSAAGAANSELNIFPELKRNHIVHDSEGSSQDVIGHLKELFVQVSDEKDMELIFTQGGFGVKTFSKSTPLNVEEKMQENLPLQDDSIGENDENLAKKKDVSSEKATKDTRSSEYEQETLQLFFEEAFFLSYTSGILVVKKDEQPLDLVKLWQTFTDINKNFPIMYAAYHHLRCNGWLVRSDKKFGCDFVIYKEGPPFNHPCYDVLVKRRTPKFEWAPLVAVHRMHSKSSTGLLMLLIKEPAGITSTHLCLPHFEVEEVLF